MTFKGLNTEEVKNSRALNGSNIMTPPKRDPWYVLLLEKFKDPLIQILSIAAIVSLVLGFIKGEFLEPIGIIAAISLAVTIGFWNEWSAQKKFDIMNICEDDTLHKVYRCSEVVEIPRKDIVVDDLVIIEAGEESPADMEVLESLNLKVDESSLTGESKAVTKQALSRGELGGTFKSYYVLKGTIIQEGSGVCVVNAVGDNTVLGKTQRQASEINDVETPLTKELNSLADLINKIAYGAAGVLITALLIRYFFIEANYIGKDWMSITNDLLSFIMIAVALIVVAVPEGLPMAVTLALAYSMKRMAKANNLVRKMHACETLGATTLILTDKTGTLTQNSMSVVDTHFSSAEMFRLNACVNSTANLDSNGNSVGNPTEGALLKYAEKCYGTGLSYRTTREAFPVLYRIDFNSENKYMLTVIKYNDVFVSLLKGAPEVVRPMCVGLESPPEDYFIQRDWSDRGRRVLANAYKESATLDDAKKLCGFTYNGIVGIEDPIREDVPNAVKQALDAGIKVKVVTGDNPATAREIARQAGISNDPQCHQLDFSPISNTVDEMITMTDVFARSKPQDKMDLVKFFQSRGEVVAMTGDGTNDAPALNYAEVGIAMNNGTAVAKEAADIILLDNSFPSIILGVKWGRSLYKNIQHFILFQLTINVAAILIACVGPFIGIDLPFTVTQMLWVNLIMDTFAALALATEPANEAVMSEKPRNPKAFIITKDMWKFIIGVGLVFTVFLIGVLYSNILSLTEFFTVFVMLQWWNLFNARVFGQKRSIFDGLLKNPAFIGISLVIICGQFLIVQFGGDLFRTESLSLTQWAYIIGGTSVVAIAREVYYQIKNYSKYRVSLTP